MELRNSQFRLSCYLPDERRGYYRGSRFDPSGMISRIEFQGHTLFGERNLARSPTATGDAIGTAEEFDLDRPPGYEEAKVGETFLKIGVGELRKPTDSKYWFAASYPIVRAAPWTIHPIPNGIEMEQSVEDVRGYRYRYTKQLELVVDQPQFVIRRTLRNTGHRILETEHYCHHFVLFDGRKVDESYGIHFPFSIEPLHGAKLAPARIEDSTVRFDHPIAAARSVWIPLLAKNPKAGQTVAVTNSLSQLSFRITPLYRPDRLLFYAEEMAACPEIFFRVKLLPGTETTWVTRYAIERFDSRTNQTLSNEP